MKKKKEDSNDLLDRMGLSSFEVVKSIPVPVIVSDRNNKVYWLNNKAKELFGNFSNYAFRNINTEGVFNTCLLTVDNKEHFFNVHVKEDHGLTVHTLEDKTNEISLANQIGKDALTGLNDRTHMKKIISREMSRVVRYDRKLSIIMIDFDHFKKVNDKYGHMVGDAALKELSVFIQQIIRETDVAFRFGGEEFLILLPNTTADQAKLFAERIRQTIENHAFQCKLKGEFECTISAGIAECKGNPSPEDFIDSADKALYQSKEEGRNRVTVAK
jgi:diguanylate cyclase (GGDEF)-like protein